VSMSACFSCHFIVQAFHLCALFYSILFHSIEAERYNLYIDRQHSISFHPFFLRTRILHLFFFNDNIHTETQASRVYCVILFSMNQSSNTYIGRLFHFISRRAQRCTLLLTKNTKNFCFIPIPIIAYYFTGADQQDVT